MIRMMKKMTMLSMLSVVGLNLCAGSLNVYNYSHYKIQVVITKNDAQGTKIGSTLAAAPKNADGSLQIHPVDTQYVAGSNVPMGTVAAVAFDGSAKDFDIQILKDDNSVLKTINVGTSLGTVVDTDDKRAVYIYSNDNLPNKGGAVFYWDSAKYPLQSPSAQAFAA